MSDKTYDILAAIQRLWIPAIATLLATLGEIWGWDFPIDKIVLTLTAIDTFMGVVLKIQSDNYFARLDMLSGLDAPEYEDEDDAI